MEAPKDGQPRGLRGGLRTTRTIAAMLESRNLKLDRPIRQATSSIRPIP